MKNIFKKLLFFSLASTAAFIPACSLVEPDTQDIVFEEEFFTKYNDAEYANQGAYAALQPLVESMFVLGEVRSDEVKPGTGATQDILELSEFRVTPTNRYTAWGHYYNLIQRTNYILANLSKVPRSANFTQGIENQFRGEALYLRSLAYFYLVRNFGDVPFILEPTKNIKENFSYPAVSQEVILDALETDLKKSLEYVVPVILVRNTSLGFDGNDTYTRKRAVRGSVHALLTDIYLWRNKYQQAADTAQKVIDNSGRYNLQTSTANWIQSIYNEGWSGEQIMHVSFNYAQRETNTLMKLTSNNPAAGGQYMIAPSDVAVAWFDRSAAGRINRPDNATENVRGFGASFAGSAPFYNRINSDKVIWKYIGNGRVTPGTSTQDPPVRDPYESDANFHIYRVADVRMMRAEALNRLGRRQEAIDLLNDLSNRRNQGNYTGLSASSSVVAVEDAILLERGKELAFEGKRWYDLLRIAKRRNDPAYLANMVTARIVDPTRKAAVYARVLNPNNWYLPYNAEEVRLNSGLNQK